MLSALASNLWFPLISTYWALGLEYHHTWIPLYTFYLVLKSCFYWGHHCWLKYMSVQLENYWNWWYQDGLVCKGIASKPDGLGSIPRTHVVEERPNFQKLFSDLHVSAILWYVCTHTLIHTHHTCTWINISEVNGLLLNALQWRHWLEWI